MSRNNDNSRTRRSVVRQLGTTSLGIGAVASVAGGQAAADGNCGSWQPYLDVKRFEIGVKLCDGHIHIDLSFFGVYSQEHTLNRDAPDSITGTIPSGIITGISGIDDYLNVDNITGHINYTVEFTSEEVLQFTAEYCEYDFGNFQWDCDTIVPYIEILSDI